MVQKNVPLCKTLTKNNFIMKKSILVLSVALSFVFFGACCSSGTTNENKKDVKTENAEANQLAEASFKVYGNCGMCKDRIEKAVKNVNGVETAEWDKETEMLKIIHKSDINIHDVHKAVAEVGHDTEMHKADDDIYWDLPKCCQYRN